MKKFTLIIAAVAFSYSIAFSQGCLPAGISFTTQAQIDNFQTNYPNCTEIEGDVYIAGWNTITNLNGLSVLTSIGGSFSIECYSISNLDGLQSLTTIMGDFLFLGGGNLYNLVGLDNLQTIGGSFFFAGSENLNNLVGLDNLQTIGGSVNFGWETMGGTLSAGLVSLTGLENLNSIGGDLYFHSNNHLQELSGLSGLTSIGGNLRITGNMELQSLTGLSGLTSIGGNLWILDNMKLQSLTGLENIDAGSITGIDISTNDLLTICEVKSICDYLASPNGGIWIRGNAPGCNSPAEVEDACATVHTEHIVSNNKIIFAPNPFTDQTVLSINFPVNGLVYLDIFNNLGMCLKNWRFEGLQTTPMQYYPDFSGIPPGVYYCRIQIGNKVLTSKLIKIY
ncbi:MAG: T9SS type A sorting domain-containing protein [Lentimicrobium sp.]|jgi:hypothetical protein|nr:T9SS type A sorting domain-containing protein [Lentimicrobium sp.]